MEKEIVRCLCKYIDYLENLGKSQSARFDELEEISDLVLRETIIPSGQKYYRYGKRGSKSFKYLGKESKEEVGLIKEARYYKESIPKIESNIKVCRKTLQRLERTDYDSIDEVLPKVYRGAKLRANTSASHNIKAESWKSENELFKESKGPWYPEGLINTTADGSLVRSKSEALIYNHYLNSNCVFVYELPTEIEPGVWRHPDFTLLCETDWISMVLHDHEGRYGFPKDRERYNRDMYLYWRNGFIPGINIFYTFDDPNGGFDISTVQNIIDSRIRP